MKPDPTVEATDDAPLLDYALDSIGCAALIAELESTFGISVTRHGVPTARTLREVWEAMERNMRDA